MQPVSVVHTQAAYPQCAPYHPSRAYPEYPFPGHVAGEENAVYDGVRQLLQQLGYDKEHYGTKTWNPLGWLIMPGMKVVLKPNFVLSAVEYVHSPKSLLEQARLCVVTLRNAEFKEALEGFRPDGPMTVVDCWRTLEREKLDKNIRLVALGRTEG